MNVQLSPAASVFNDSTVEFKCSWGFDTWVAALMVRIYIDSGSGLKQVYSKDVHHRWSKVNPGYQSRLSVPDHTKTSFIMSIQNTQCMDEGEYACEVEFRDVGAQVNHNTRRSLPLYVKGNFLFIVISYLSLKQN